ncbi:alpha/beta fold hydrolase [Deinococcus alpinitundrae]|uniref:alpha/beta fold hydrolase n=1 Tax=Deinococcus alpinitundrae TaxID=468913 RepID=UPI00192A231A|nr:alpha/beta fold hydrolase [Deinococcus alpinitundrae]
MTTSHIQTTQLRPDLSLTFSEAGSGRPALILHGGGGPFTVAGIAEHLSSSMHTFLPTHPGWNGTEQLGDSAGIEELAQLYLAFLEMKDLRDVLVIGSSLGGWIGAEMALRDRAGLISGLILVDAVGVEIVGEPIRDFFALNAREVAEYSYHDAGRFYVDPSSLAPQQLAGRQANMAAMRAVAGQPYMHRPELLGQLKAVRIPALVLWGESDRIVTPAYGRAYAQGFGNAQFELIERAGHLPQLEQPAATLARIDAYLSAQGT